MNAVQQQLRYANRTGKCPICKERLRVPVSKEGTPGRRVTCGSEECVKQWVRPKTWRDK